MNKKETVLQLIAQLIKDKTPVSVKTTSHLLDFYVDQGSQRSCYLASLYNNEKWWFNEKSDLTSYVFLVNRLNYKGVSEYVYKKDLNNTKEYGVDYLLKQLDDIQLATICLKEKDIEDCTLVYESQKKFSLKFENLVITTL